jgi:uncharacterized coiled-coil protein SlyX
VNVTKIFDNALNPTEIAQSTVFKNGQFLVFTTPNLPQNQGVEIGFSLIVYIPISIFQTVTKYVVLPSFEFVRQLSSFSIIEIPREYSESGCQMFAAFNSSIAVSQFQCYAITSDVTQESINQEIVNLQAEVTQLQNQVTSLTNLVTELVATNSNDTLVNEVIPLLKTVIPLLLAGI